MVQALGCGQLRCGTPGSHLIPLASYYLTFDGLYVLCMHVVWLYAIWYYRPAVRRVSISYYSTHFYNYLPSLLCTAALWTGGLIRTRLCVPNATYAYNIVDVGSFYCQFDKCRSLMRVCVKLSLRQRCARWNLERSGNSSRRR